MGGKNNMLKALDRYVGGVAVRVLGAWHFHRTLGPPFVEIVRERVRRVLFIRPGGMGDLLLLLPSVMRVKRAFPGVHLTLAGETRNRAVTQLTDVFDEVLCYDHDPLGFLRRLREGRFDVAVDTEQFHYSSSIFAFLSGAPVRIGFKINPARNELYTHLVDYPMDRHESVAFSWLVRPLCGESSEDPAATGFVDASRLPARVPGLADDERGFVAMFPYGGAREKAWPAGRWAEIVKRVIERGAGRVVLVGGSDSAALASELLRSVNDPRLQSLVGRVSLAETAAVIARARLYIGCDTGVTHLAHALGRPTVVLFGASDERKWGPPPGAGESVTTAVPCRPCAIYGYVKRCRTIDCMDRVTTDQVWRAVDAALARTEMR